jgi:hypothetical protein
MARITPSEAKHPKQAQILALFERPEQFVTYLARHWPDEIAGERASIEAWEEERNAVLLLFTAYIQELLGGSSFRGSVRFTFLGPSWVEPNKASVVLPDWVGSMVFETPNVLAYRKTPVAKIQKVLAAYSQSIQPEDAAPPS